MNAVIYTRMSNEDRDNKKFSPISQEKVCRAYAELHGINVACVLSDEISGVYPLEQRPAGRELLAMAGQVGAVIVYRLDRLGRPDFATWDYGLVLNIISQLAQLGIEVHDTENGPIRNDLGSITMAFMKSIVASEERRAIRKRTMDGRLDAARAGKWVGGGVLRFGLKQEAGGGLVIDENEAAVIRRAYDLYLKQNMSFNEIARKFSQENIPTKKGLTGWHPSTVTRAMTGRHVIGELWYKGVMVPCPAIVSQEAYEAVIAARRQKFTRKDGATVHNYLLSGGRLKCRCGATMGGVHKTDKRCHKTYTYYTCASHSRRWMLDCNEKPVRADEADREVWAEIVRLFDSGELRGIVADVLAEQNETAGEQAARRQKLLKLVRDKRRKIDVLFSEFAEDEPMIAEHARRHIRQLAAEVKGLEQEAGRLASTAQSQAAALSEIDALTDQVRDYVLQGGGNRRRDIMDALGVQCHLVHQGEGRAIKADFFC